MQGAQFIVELQQAYKEFRNTLPRPCQGLFRTYIIAARPFLMCSS